MTDARTCDSMMVAAALAKEIPVHACHPGDPADAHTLEVAVPVLANDG